MKLCLCTDIHLNFLDEQQIKQFCLKLEANKPEAILCCGDISEAHELESHLSLLEKNLSVPVWFVLGNHDYYRSSISAVSRKMKYKYGSNTSKKVNHVPSTGVVRLTDKTVLVGTDGWYDGGYSNWFRSPNHMCDYQLVEELVCNNDINLRYKVLQDVAKGFAKQLELDLSLISKSYKNVVVITHVPPFKQNSTYRGKISDETWLPHFSSKATGDVLLEAAENNPEQTFTVFCGHTHDGAMSRQAPNLVCYTIKSDYGHPERSITYLDVE